MKDIGIGVDIERIERFQKLEIIKNKNFFEKIYTKAEINYCFSKDNPAPCLAVRFAGKEAIVKALGDLVSLKEPIDYKKIEILDKEYGAPEVKILDDNFSLFRAAISLSHCDDRAIAFAIITKDK